MVKITLATCVVCERYQFLGFYVKQIPKIGKLIFGLSKSESPKVFVGLLLCRACQDEYHDVKIVEIRARMWKIWFIENHE